MDDGFVSVPGGRVWYRVEGGGATPLLCLHGGPGFAHDYLSPLLALADERPVVLYDQLGCGRSDRPADDSLWSLDRSIAEVHALRLALGLNRLHLLGHSWGGFLALSYALEHRGLSGLVLASPLVSVPRWLEDARGLRRQLPRDLIDTLDRHEVQGFTSCPEYQAATFEYYRRHLCRLDPWPPELERSFAGFGTEVYESMWGPTEFHATGSLVGMDLTSRLGELEMPVLYTCGRHDECTPEAVASFEAATVDARLVVFETSSHMAHIEEPGRFTEVVRTFLRQVDSGR
jgi:proline-specific peptidase